MSDIYAKNSGFGIGESVENSGDATLSTIDILKKIPAQKMVRCSCGHTVPQSLAMMANLGSSCPDCYNRMSGI